MIAKIIEASARNRLLVFLGVVFAVIAAVSALRRVKLDAIPDLSDAQVIVFTQWMGRSPDLVENQITYPISSALISAPSRTTVVDSHSHIINPMTAPSDP